VYRSISNNVNTVANCEANGTLLNAGGTQNMTTFNATGLNPATTYYFNVIVADMAGNKAAYVYKELTTTNVGIASTTLSNQITVYPNPTTGEFKVQCSMFNVQSIEIFDVFGRKAFEQKAESRKQNENLTVLLSYDITLFPAGIYFIKITTEQGVVTKKVIKQ
jgi:hypothetical protein